jgi:predicted dehydrogenase
MTIRVGVLGLGFMGRTHIRAYNAAERDGLPCSVVALASPRTDFDAMAPAQGNLEASASAPLFDPARVRRYETAEALAADRDVELVSICTPTDTHVGFATLMLRSGKHVLVEKPVALRSTDIDALDAIVRKSSRVCMPAMCMRFWPGWDWLKARVDDRTHGAVRSITFTRLGARPSWSPEFYRDPSRCGGGLLDLHIHDADVLFWLFGPPSEVISRGTIDHVTTLYRYDSGPRHAVAHGGWVDAPGFPFRMRYTAEFEHAVADWDLSREKPLLLTQNGATTEMPLPRHVGYDGEIRALVTALSQRATTVGPTLREASTVLRILEAEKRSLESGAPVRL